MTAIAKVSYTHDAMIDLIIANPAMSQNDIAKHFGYTPGWISQVFSSDSFAKRLAERKGELVDTQISLTIEENLAAVARKSCAVLMEKLDLQGNPHVAVRALDVVTRALGYGAREAKGPVQNNFIVNVPGKAATSEEWERAYGRPSIDVTPERTS